jgi:glycosyltransferase involved in cell wall biosynthesis
VGSIDVWTGRVSGDAPSRFGGWVLFPSESVSEVVVGVDGHWLGGARLGLARPDLAALTPRPEAPVCGFEYWLHPGDLPRGTDEVTLSARARSVGGSVVGLPDVTVPVSRERPDVGDGSALVRDPPAFAHLGYRVRRMARRRRIGRHEPRLLAFAHELNYAGGPLYLVELLSHLRSRAGVSCSVVSLEDGPLRRSLESMGIPVHVTSSAHARDPVSYEGKVCELAAWVAAQGFDILYINTLDSYIGADIATRLDLPAIWAIHESFDPAEWWAVNGGAPRGHVWDRMRAGLASAGALLFATETTRRQFLDYADPERAVTMPYGISLERIDRYRERFDRSSARRRLGIDGSTRVVLSVATIEPRKAQTCLSQAFATLAAAHPEATLVLVGETRLGWSAPYVSALRDYLRRAGLESRVRIMPVTTDYYEWLGLADLFVLASDIESLPLIVLEAMAFELPVVATTVFGIPELVKEGETGYLCPPRNVAALADAVRRALTSAPARRAAVAEAAAGAVRDRHDVRRYAERIAGLLDALAEDPGALPSAALAGS